MKKTKDTIEQPAWAVLWTAEGQSGIYSPLADKTHYAVFYDKALAQEWLDGDKVHPGYKDSSVIVPCTIVYEKPVPPKPKKKTKKMPPKTK